MEDANASLEAAKKKPGVAHGAIWWMQKSMAEAQRLLPARAKGM